MLTIGLAEAQERLGSLVELAEAGEVVCIMRRGRQVAKLTGLDAYTTDNGLAAGRNAAAEASLA